MFHSIAKAFRALDDFLTRCEEYTEQRVWNGKFIDDLQFLSATTIDNIKESLKNTSERVQSSNAYTATLAFLRKFAGLLMQISIIEDSVLLVIEGFRLSIKYFAHYLIILITGLCSAYLLLMTFKQAPVFFVLLFLPLLYANHLFLSGFFKLVENKEQGNHISFLGALSQLKQTIPANTYIFCLQIALVVIAAVFHLGFAFLLSTLFGYISIEWSSTFLYWLPVVMVGLLIVILLYIAEVILSFSYTFVQQEKQTTYQALQRSSNIMQNDFRYSLLFYVLLTLFAVVFIANTSITNYEGGFMVSALFMSHAFLILGFILRRKYFGKEPAVQSLPFIEKAARYFKPVLGLGCFSYIAAAILMVQLQPDIIHYLNDQRPTVAATYEYTTYRNPEAGYTIQYPKPWTTYRWNDMSSTIYTNDTGTDIGGVKVNIDIRSIEESNYLALYEANPGLIRYDTGTKNVTTKIANVVIKGNNAVKYTYTNTDSNQLEFQTHYLIRSEQSVYDIALITSSKKIEASYMEIFELMVASFTLE